MRRRKEAVRERMNEEEEIRESDNKNRDSIRKILEQASEGRN